jgi:hypothetical protein
MTWTRVRATNRGFSDGPCRRVASRPTNHQSYCSEVRIESPFDPGRRFLAFSQGIWSRAIKQCCTGRALRLASWVWRRYELWQLETQPTSLRSGHVGTLASPELRRTPNRFDAMATHLHWKLPGREEQPLGLLVPVEEPGQHASARRQAQTEGGKKGTRRACARRSGPGAAIYVRNSTG